MNLSLLLIFLSSHVQSPLFVAFHDGWRVNMHSETVRVRVRVKWSG